MPTYSLTVNGTQISQGNCVMPAKYNEHLDEQLDLASVSVFAVQTEIYPQFCRVSLTITGNQREGEQPIQKYYRLMADNSVESPNGSGFYKHDLTLIEETKFLEGFIVESLCVTNAGGREYNPITPTLYNEGGDGTLDLHIVFGNTVSPVLTGDKIYFPQLKEQQVGNQGGTITVSFSDGTTSSATINNDGTISPEYVIAKNGINNFYYNWGSSYAGVDSSATGEFDIWAQPNYYPLKPWTYIDVINRALELCEPLIWDFGATKIQTQNQSMEISLSGNPPSFSETGTITGGIISSAVILNKAEFIRAGIRIGITYTDTTYTVTASANSTPVPILTAQIKITVQSQGDYVVPPRFTFRYNDPNNAQEVALFNSFAPEFTFTRCTLRELLQTIGGAIHKEPRLDESNNIYFVDFGGQELAQFTNSKTGAVQPLNEYPYIKKTSVWELEQACTRLDAHIDNLVNQISIGNSTTGQPFLGGAQSLRTDSAYIRVTEDSAIFPTALPILKPSAFYWVDWYGIAGSAYQRYDITNFLFEKSVYDSQLSSYSVVYPVSKAYGVYYTQGEKNIGGLFFENTEWSGGVFAQPAIVNILRSVTGNSTLLSGASSDDYAKLCFELEYTPIYSARIQHGKQYTGDFLEYPRTIAHNQSANMVEAQYFGENIKGMAERLGNVEKAYTFLCKYTSTIPTAGQKWDEDYCISDVAVEVLNPYFKVTIGLTKNFNRKSKYIGANSYRRIFEVSERMVQERNTIYSDYLVIVPYDYTPPTSYTQDFLLTFLGFTGVYSAFTQTQYDIAGTMGVPYKVSGVIIQGQTKNGLETLPEVVLPVVASAFGNVMEFSYAFQDNFSAGAQSVYQNNTNITGYFTTEVQYCDYYGRMYYENISFAAMNNVNRVDPDSLPAYNTTTPTRTNYIVAQTQENFPIICRKDSREALSGSYAVETVTSIKGYVIGSALASNNPMVSGLTPAAQAKLVILNQPFNTLSRYVDLSSENVSATYQITTDPRNASTQLYIRIVNPDTAPSILFQGLSATAAGQAWALVTPQYSGTPYTVGNEDGTTETLTPTYGGELLIGFNGPVSVGDTIAQFRIIGVHDIYKFIESQQNQED